jgi:hypothetical protein
LSYRREPSRSISFARLVVGVALSGWVQGVAFSIHTSSVIAFDRGAFVVVVVVVIESFPIAQ